MIGIAGENGFAKHSAVGWYHFAKQRFAPLTDWVGRGILLDKQGLGLRPCRTRRGQKPAVLHERSGVFTLIHVARSSYIHLTKCACVDLSQPNADVLVDADDLPGCGRKTRDLKGCVGFLIVRESPG